MVRLLGRGGREGGVGAEVVEVEGGGVGGEEERLRRLGVQNGGGIDRVTIMALRPDTLAKAIYTPHRKRLGIERDLERWLYLCSGTAILLATCPVSVAATFTIPSVPAENNCSPS